MGHPTEQRDAMKVKLSSMLCSSIYEGEARSLGNVKSLLKWEVTDQGRHYLLWFLRKTDL